MRATDDGRLIDLLSLVTRYEAATAGALTSGGETKGVAMPEPEESFVETRFEVSLSVGDAFCLSAKLFLKSLVGLFPFHHVMIEC